ncbi:hypothetical protein M422DRAFT_785226 [Sphaerobolus stellatus SS14]|uniref:Uncharacterized protein n=1 Tax=Sphaerobolus stellatus (strain SS14) TaxID=990650 RepID=A0A0C9UBN9_SPHS4|nr:hypothetical protein M422DRAFT_785226 [Sphaerobolus stellatus SS14]
MHLRLPLLGILTILGAIYLIYWSLSVGISNFIFRKFSAVDDLKLIGKRRKGGKFQGVAVVSGGSISGLLAARILSDHFKKVVIVEAEEWLTTEQGLWDGIRCSPKKRYKVSQYTFMHCYQAFLGHALRYMFPDFQEELEKVGGKMATGPFNAQFSGIPLAYEWRTETPDIIFSTRPVLESTIRRVLLNSFSNVEYLPGSVYSLVRAAKSGPIEGVLVRKLDGKKVTLSAEFVVDCTGSAYSGLRWLQELGLRTERGQALDEIKETYNHNVLYSFCEADVPKHILKDLRPSGAYAGKAEDHAKGIAGFHYWLPDASRERQLFGIVRQENNILHMAYGAWGLSKPPKTLADLRDNISGLSLNEPVPEWAYNILDTLEKENVPVKFETVRMPPGVYIRYTGIKDLPANLVAIGDSVHKANAVRGQGCTKACIDAVTLNTLLCRTSGQTLPTGFSRRFFALQDKRTGAIWSAGKTEDYAWDTTIPCKGEDLAVGSFARTYMKYVGQLIVSDPEVTNIFMNVVHFFAPGLVLFSPRILRKVLRLWIADGWGKFKL